MSIKRAKMLPRVAIVAALGLAGASANAAFLPFTVDEGSVPDATANAPANVGKFTGLYSEIITINDDFSLDYVGVVSWAGLGDVDGGPVPNQIGCFGPNCYDTYAIFMGSGTFTGSDFSITSGTLQWLIDPDQDTEITFNGGGADGVTISGTVDDDYDIANAVNLALGIGIPGTPGAFQAIWDDLVLTAEGEAYFPAPDPFYMVVEATGDFDQDTFAPGTFLLTGDVSAAFEVPEPASIALLGLGMLGFAARRRRAAV